MNNVKIGLNINSECNLLMSNTTENLVVSGITYNSVTYIELNEFSKEYDVSTTSVRRLLRRVESKDCSQYYLKMENKIYASKRVLLLKDKNFSLLNEMQGNWATHLAGYEWDWFVSVRYTNAFKQKSAVRVMNSLFKKLSDRFKANEFRMFFVTEKNKADEGYHSHFLLHSDVVGGDLVRELMQEYFQGHGGKPFADADIRIFNPNLGAIAYTLKEIHLHPDSYDLKWKNKKSA